MNQINVSLSQLTLSPQNVRKTVTGGVAELAASIHAHGLLQNLTVVERGEQFEVVAGSMRLRALQDLAKRSLIAETYVVPCNVIDASEAYEASLTENVTRSAMHPADEFEAFDRLVEDGATIGDVAARFGKTERYVQQRMKLANIAPTILAEYRAGDATLEQMMALAITDDQKLQLRVWKAARGNWQREPDHLRGVIVEGEFAVDSQLGKFVGLKAYEEAGGKVRRDLFGEESDSFLVDSELVMRLAQEKLERTAEKIRKEGWGWVEARIKFDWEEKSEFDEAPVTWKGNKRTYTDDVKQHAGAVVHLGYNGQAEIERGLVKPEDRKGAKAGTKGQTAPSAKARPDRKPDDLSFASIQRLQAEAGQIVALHVSDDPDIALALLAAELADKVFYEAYGGPRQWIRIHREGTGRMPGSIRNEVMKTGAGEELAKEEKTWREALPKKRAEARAWILEQGSTTIRNLLAFLVAREIDVVDLAPRSPDGVTSLASAIHVDLGSSWKPSKEWLATVPKRTVLAMLKEAGVNAVDLGKLEKEPKAKFVASALPMFPVGWLPKPLRAAVDKKPKAKRAKAAPKPNAATAEEASPASKGSTPPDFPWASAE